ncbi:MAG: hypothetical protein LBM96_09490 [Methanobrevibacter sp.]|jgi:hypothetical protein|nr:hypothetical protein [Candidatus Methanoflexus mossambicus]
MIKVIQSWWHSEDIILSSSSKAIKQVLDIYTDEEIIPYMIDSNFLNFKVKSRFKNMELEFIQEYNKDLKFNSIILINLGNLDNWPKVDYNLNINLRHVKIQVEYMDTNPYFEEIKFLNLIIKGFSSSYMIKDSIQPEFDIKLPLGMKLKDSSEGNITLLLEENVNNDIAFTELEIENNNFYRYENKNLKYYFLINEKSYDKILQSINISNTFNNIFIQYDIVYQNKFWLVSIFPFIMLILGIINIIFVDLSKLLTFNISGMAIFFSYITFYYSLIKEGYELPLTKKFIISILVLSGSLILFPFIFKSLLTNIIYFLT